MTTTDKMAIIYQTENGIAVITPTLSGGYPITEIALKDVPPGLPYIIVADTDVPDRTFREAWEADFSVPAGFGADWGVGSHLAVVGYDKSGAARKFRDQSNGAATAFRSAASVRKTTTEPAQPNGAAITINLEKAREIAHDIRRQMRDAEFVPLDDVIAKQIPGTDFATIEAQRETVRQKYAAMQANIDAAGSPEELKVIITPAS